jgi:hypothetical protein
LLPLVGLALLQGVALLVQGCVCAPPLAFGESLCGVAGVTAEPAAPDCDPLMDEDEALPVELLGVALSWVLEGVAGLELVVVVDCCVVVVDDGLLVVSVLVLCASASVPVRSRPAARIDTFFM